MKIIGLAFFFEDHRRPFSRDPGAVATARKACPSCRGHWGQGHQVSSMSVLLIDQLRSRSGFLSGLESAKIDRVLDQVFSS